MANGYADEYGEYEPKKDSVWYSRAYNQAAKAKTAQARAGVVGEADIYRKALEKAEYGQLSRDLSQGNQGITNYLAGAGPLADSGVQNTLRTKLASQLYGAAQGRTQGGYASYLRELMGQRRNYEYQMKLQKQAQKAANRFDPLAFAGAAASFIPGVGPVLNAARALPGYQASVDNYQTEFPGLDQLRRV